MVKIANIVVGAGPAGLQLAYFLKQRGEGYVVVERNDHPGSFFGVYPRRRRLISINKRFTGCQDAESRLRYDWNSLLGGGGSPLFTDYAEEYFPSADVMPRYLSDYASHHDLEVRYGSELTLIARGTTGFRLEFSERADLECDRLFVGTGLSRENLPDIDGVELCETYATVELDPDAYRDRRVMIVGKGNSAFETADSLLETTQKIWVCGPTKVRLAWATHYVGDLRAINNNFLDTYQLKAQNNILDGELKRVRRSPSGALSAEVYFESRRRSYEYECDHVILCTGFRFDATVFSANCRPEMRPCGRLPLMTSEWESTNVPGLHFVGTLMQSRDYRRTMSAFIHGFRHNIQALNDVLEQRKTGTWPSQEALPASSAAVAKRLIERLSTSAALLLQPGFLCDALIVDSAGELRYLRDVPVDYALEKLLPTGGRLYLATLEYKQHDGSIDPFAMPRGVGVAEDYYLHPVVRRHQVGASSTRVFLPDDLDNDWRNDESHFEALRACFAEELGECEPTAPALHSFVAELGPGQRASRTGAA